MESLYLLIPIAIVFVFIAVVVFIWAVKSEQFDDLERQGMNILLEEHHTSTKSHLNSSPKLPPSQSDK